MSNVEPLIPQNMIISRVTFRLETKQSSNDKTEKIYLGSWFSSYNFIAVCVGNLYSVRSFAKFAKYCNLHGGINFLVAYLFVAITVGIPILFADMLLGQYTGHGSLRAYSIIKCMKGISFSHFIINGILSISSLIITSRSLVYMIHSIYVPVPWNHCNNSWNGKYCIALDIIKIDQEYQRLNSSNMEYIGYILSTRKLVNYTIVFLNFSEWNISTNSPILYYLFFVTFMYIFIEIIKKPFMIYISPILVSYTLVMTIIIIMLGVTLPGSGNGLKKLVIPKMRQLLNLSLWNDVAGEVLLTYGIGFGSILTMSSYCSLNVRINRNLWTIVLIEFIMSFIGSIATMEFLGAYEKMYNFNYRDISRDVSLYLFYTSVLLKFPYYNLLAFGAFFLMFIQNVNKQIVNVEVLNMGLIEYFNISSPIYVIRRNITRSLIYIISLFFSLMLAYLNLTYYVISVLDEYCTFLVPVIIALFQVITISFLYGLKELSKNYQEISFKPLPKWIKFCLLTISPVLLTVISISKFTLYKNNYYAMWVEVFKYPWFTGIIGWTTNFIVIFPIPAYFIYTYFNIKKNNWELSWLNCLKLCIQPNKNLYRFIKI